MGTRPATMLAVAVYLVGLVSVSNGQGCVSDMMLLIDGSSTIGSTNFENLRTTVEILINDTYLNYPGVRIGLVVFGSSVTTNTNLYSGDSQTLLLSFLRNAPYPNSGRNTHLAIDQARTTITNLGRSASPKDIVLVTIGIADNSNLAIQAANSARGAGASLYALGIESDLIGTPVALNNFQQELAQIAPSRVQTVTDITAVPSTLGNIANTVCKVLIVTGLSTQSVFTTEAIILTATLNQRGINNGFWRKNGVALPQSPRYSVTVDGEFQRLIIVNAQTSDAGTYTFSVLGETTTASVTVNAVIVSFERTVLSYVGQTVTLSVTLQVPNCNLQGQWSKGGIPLNIVGRLSYTTEQNCLVHKLTVSPATVSDTGTYSFTYQSQTISGVITISTSSAPVNGGFSQWTQWSSSQCPVTCGTNAFKTEFRSRECNSPFPQNGGISCIGDYNQTQTVGCGLLGCPVNGGLTQWTEWNGASVACPQTCGTNAVKSAERVRTCTSPRPQNGGLFCVGNLFERISVSCGLTNECPTPVDGGVTNWGFWVIPSCNVTCGIGAVKLVQRTRTCTNPPPSPNGINCVESLSQTAIINCGLTGCPVNGGISQWSEWNDNTVQCPVTCGFTATKTVQRFRACTNPPAQNGGADCPETNRLETKTISCGFAACTSVVNGGVGQWSSWNTDQVACGVTCGINAVKTIQRSRLCNNPPPSPTGRPCLEQLTETTQINCQLIGCPVNGGFGSWQPWNSDSVQCSVTCGLQARKQVERFRFCNNPVPSNGGAVCDGLFIETQFVSCNTPACPAPVNGGVSQWGAWNSPACAVTCGNAFKTITRFRTCTNPPPSNNGIDCAEPLTESTQVSCALFGCPVNGGVGSWGQWGAAACGASCGPSGSTGRALRTRLCNNPPPQNEGAECTESLTETAFRNCNYNPCPAIIDGGVSEWTAWSTSTACSVTCGSATRVATRVRFCNNPAPSNGGRTCLNIGFTLSQTIQVDCELPGCPINGGISQWGQWSLPACAATCGLNQVRTITRNRQCNNPAPSNGGADCFESRTETQLQSCGLPECPTPVDGGLTQWSTWVTQACILTCGSNAITYGSRLRSCTNPPPRNGGAQCIGARFETKTFSCNLNNCPVNGGLSPWGQWSVVNCQFTCGQSVTTTATRTRTCTNPPPSNGGSDCSFLGSTVETQQRSCNVPQCPINGGLSQWTQWNVPSCSSTCGSTLTTTATRVRFCNNPSPSFGGNDCSLLGSLGDSEIRNCGLPTCAIDGGLSIWSQWNVVPCSSTCGTSLFTTANRFRTCTNPPPADGGNDCTGLGATSETQTRSCNVQPCPINGGLTQWSQWNVVPCGVTCGFNIQTTASRFRTCTNPTPNFGGADCTGQGATSETQQRSCNLNNCPTNGGLSQWTQWNVPSCSSTCGSTLRTTATRVRFCNNPSPSFGGNDCSLLGSLSDSEIRSCGLPACPTDGGYTQWSAWNVVPCLLSCGPSLFTSASRFRFCTNPPPADGGRNCSLLGAPSQTETRSCNLPNCPINGGLSQWTQWNVIPCSATCGAFTTSASRFRTCTNPVPQFNGNDCTGLGATSQTESRSCNLPTCRIDGGFTQWTTWNVPSCFVTCGTNVQRTVTRTRTCTNPVPQFGGQNCTGDNFESFSQNCGLPSCARDGGISQWSAWETPACIITCGETATFYAYRQRFCNNPSPRDGGADCPESRWDSEMRNCGLPPCPLDGGMTQWSQWNIPPCTQTCGRLLTRTVSRSRSCNNPSPANGGSGCTAPVSQQEVRNCQLPSCPINGGLSQWTQWSIPPCTRTCGSNVAVTISRNRFCNNPYPQYGGSNCTGSLNEVTQRSCQLPVCRVDGGLSNWGQWSLTPCTQTCGINLFTQATRFRTCTDPVPSNGGVGCTGPFSETTTRGCNLNHCPVNGGLTQWTNWNVPVCAVTCGNNRFVTAHRYRSCTLPIPRYGGANCSGSLDETQSRSCNISPCPINGGLTQWGAWVATPCPATCGTQVTRSVSRTRTCTNPSPRNGGLGCTQSLFESVTRACGLQNCPVNGGISAWTQWDDPGCPITCGPNARKTVTRTRLCNNPVPQYGGALCTENYYEYESRSCGLGNCPVNGGVTQWTQWSDPPCSVTCGNGITRTVSRTRTCTNPAPQFGGDDCTEGLSDTTTLPCSLPNCPVDGGLSNWTPWSNPPCAVTCGTAATRKVSRTRLCTNPVPLYGGADCGNATVLEEEIRSCNFPQCPGTQGLCQATTIVNGVGYRYHPTDCDKYIQCYYNPNGFTIAAYRSCPFGYYWDSRTLRCDFPWKVNCPLEKCTANCTANYNMEGSCRAHWVCDKGVSKADCCPMGFRFVVGQGCRPDFYCRDPCPTPCASRDVCDKRPDWSNNPGNYNISVGLLGWLQSSCVSGNYFDLLECGCSVPQGPSCTPDYQMTFTNNNALANAKSTWLSMMNVNILDGYALFDGIGHMFINITQKAPAEDCPLIIRFRFTESQNMVSRKILASTSDCYKANTLVIAYEPDAVVFEMTSVFGQIFRMPISLNGFSSFEWKTVTMIYNGNMIIGVVESNNLRYMQMQYAPEINLMECGMRFGSDGSMSTAERFIGALDSFSIYRCNPGNLYQLTQGT